MATLRSSNISNNNKTIIRKRRRQKITHTPNKIRANGKKRTKLKDTEGGRTSDSSSGGGSNRKGKKQQAHTQYINLYVCGEKKIHVKSRMKLTMRWRPKYTHTHEQWKIQTSRKQAQGNNKQQQKERQTLHAKALNTLQKLVPKRSYLLELVSLVYLPQKYPSDRLLFRSHLFIYFCSKTININCCMTVTGSIHCKGMKIMSSYSGHSTAMCLKNILCLQMCLGNVHIVVVCCSPGLPVLLIVRLFPHIVYGVWCVCVRQQQQQPLCPVEPYVAEVSTSPPYISQSCVLFTISE